MAIDAKDKLVTLESLKTAFDAEGDLREAADTALGTRIDNIITPEGDASLSEVVDARLGTDGTTYRTLNARINAEVTALDGEIDGVKADLSDTNERLIYDEKIINAGDYTIQSSDLVSGVWECTTPSANANRLRSSDMFPVKKGTIINYTTGTGQEIYLGLAKSKTSGSSGFLTAGWVSGTGLWTIAKDGYITFNVRKSPDGAISVSDYNSDVTIRTALSNHLKRQEKILGNFGVPDAYNAPFQNGRTFNGVTYTPDEENDCVYVSGTASSGSFYNLIANDIKDTAYLCGQNKKYLCYFEKTGIDTQNVKIALFKFQGDTMLDVTYYPNSGLFSLKMESDITKFIIRIDLKSGITADCTVRFHLFDIPPMDSTGRFVCSHDVDSYITNDSITLSDITKNGIYQISQNINVTDFDDWSTNDIASLEVRSNAYLSVNVVCQRLTIYKYNTKNIRVYERWMSTAGVIWTDWVQIGHFAGTDSYNGIDLVSRNRIIEKNTRNGITYKWDSNKEMYHITGSFSESVGSFYNICTNFNVSVGQAFYLCYESGTTNVYCEVWRRKTSDNSLSLLLRTTDTINYITIPSDTETIYVRLFIPYTEDAIDEYANAWIAEDIHGRVADLTSVTQNLYSLPSCDLDTLLKSNDAWLLAESKTYSNTPNNYTTGFLVVRRFENWTLQVYYNLRATEIWLRRADNSDVWSEWSQIKGSGNTYNITNQYYTNHYEETLTATVTPTITTDTNNYLAPSGDSSDRKTDIETLLATGVCRLGPGDYYVSGVYMPNNTMLIGSGRSTRLILLGNNTGDNITEGYAIHFGNSCTVRDMMIMGSTSTLSCSTYNYAERHGIMWEATYNVNNQSTKVRGIVDGCEIVNFPGGGITCYNTGYPVNSTLIASNCFIYNCMVGINIPYWSEFNMFSCDHVRACYYGCVNNGGNNLFTSCNFSANIVGMLCDNGIGETYNKSPNNTHGSVIGCIFDHENSNNGIGIKMEGCHAGEVFSDCQLFFADIVVNNCSGVQFNNFNSGTNVDITVTKGTEGGTVIFKGWIFKDGYTISSDYSNCKFIDCYTRTGVQVTGNT